MELKKLSHRSESLLNIILSNLIKDGKWINGKPWTKITMITLSKILKCTTRSISQHVKKLESDGILLKEQLNKTEHDRTNYYSINPNILSNTKLLSFFNASIRKKIHVIYNKGFNNNYYFNNYYLNPQTSHDLKQNNFIDIKVDVAISHQCGIVNSRLGKERKSTASEMLKVWNSEFDKKEGMSRQLARYLVASYRRKFDSSMEEWHEYVKLLKGSKFIVSLSNRIQSLLKWALSFKVINRIFSGGFDIPLWKVLGVNSDNLLVNDSLSENHIESLQECEECKEVRRVVIETYGEAVYMSWFTKIILERRGNYVMITGNSFIVENVKRRFLRGKNFIENPIYEHEIINTEDRSDKSDIIDSEYIGRERINILFGQ